MLQDFFKSWNIFRLDQWHRTLKLVKKRVGLGFLYQFIYLIISKEPWEEYTNSESAFFRPMYWFWTTCTKVQKGWIGHKHPRSSPYTRLKKGGGASRTTTAIFTFDCKCTLIICLSRKMISSLQRLNSSPWPWYSTKFIKVSF